MATTEAYTSFGFVRDKDAQYAQSETDYRRSIEMFERLNTGSTIQASAPLLNLAMLMTRTKKYNQVEPLLLPSYTPRPAHKHSPRGNNWRSCMAA